MRRRACSPAGRSRRRASASGRRAELQRAAAALDACGARPAAATTPSASCAGSGTSACTAAAGPATPTATGVELLTERELEVARLVVDRKTNTEIAAELFLSRKTVETHLRNLFHKLEVSSRVEVARVVERADRAAQR